MTDELKSCPECNGTGVNKSRSQIPLALISRLSQCPICGGTGFFEVTKPTRKALMEQLEAANNEIKRLELDHNIHIAEMEAELAEAKHDAELFKKQFNDLEPLFYEARAKAGELLLEREKPRWIAVTPETMPEDDVEVVGLHIGRDYWNLRIATYLAETNCWTEESHVLAEGTITHYMRLPELPEEQQ